MSTNDYWGDYQPGEVRALAPDQDPPVSSLVEALQGHGESATEAIVLRGYLGRSDILSRAVDYLNRARRIAEANWADVRTRALAPLAEQVEEAAVQSGVPPLRARAIGRQIGDAVRQGTLAAGIEQARNAAVTAGLQPAQAQALAQQIGHMASAGPYIAGIEELIAGLEQVRERAEPHIPWRLFLTPRLDCYVDFHRSALLAYRREAKADRQDACTVWLRSTEDEGRRPIPYRLVYENIVGPSYAQWLDGQIVDDYVEQPTSGSAWGDQTGVYGGFRTGTGKSCLG